jgi:hypothetical protein
LDPEAVALIEGDRVLVKGEDIEFDVGNTLRPNPLQTAL